MHQHPTSLQKPVRCHYLTIWKCQTKDLIVERFPVGYPLQAAFQSSEPNFSIYRSFSYLHSRVILEMQDELRSLEDNLEKMDKRDDLNEERQDCLMSREADLMQAKRDGRPSERANLLTRICDKLMKYDEILLKARELNAFQIPSNRDYTSLRNWFDNECHLSSEAEMEFVKRKEDLITLRQGREWAGFDGWIESWIKLLPPRVKRVKDSRPASPYQQLTTMQKVFMTPELREKTNSKAINYVSASRVDKLVGLIITIIIFVLLVLPVVAMYKLTSVGDDNSTIKAVGVLVVFTLLFSAAMSFVTKAKRHELFAASAAYCAVLVVFISNFGNDTRS